MNDTSNLKPGDRVRLKNREDCEYASQVATPDMHEAFDGNAVLVVTLVRGSGYFDAAFSGDNYVWFIDWIAEILPPDEEDDYEEEDDDYGLTRPFLKGLEWLPPEAVARVAANVRELPKPAPIPATPGPPELEGVPRNAFVVYWLDLYGPSIATVGFLRSADWFKSHPENITFHVGPIMPPGEGDNDG